MLLQFTVENYRSFKEPVILSLEASCEKEHLNNVIKLEKESVLKNVVVFGANAAGKTNLFKALLTGIMIVRESNKLQIGECLDLICPFALDEEMKNKPTSFEFVFIFNNVKYVYGYSATKFKVVKEYLYVYKSSKATTIFERNENNHYKFTINSLKNSLKDVIDKNTDNKLFLATSAMYDCDETREPMQWFLQGINVLEHNYDILLETTGQMIEKDYDGSLSNFIKNMLHEADLNISNYECELNNEKYHINAVHKVKDKQGNIAEYKLDLYDESHGTQNLFFFSPFIKRAFQNGETLCIDEFDAGLHPMLVTYLIDLFNNKEVNKNNAQLIISTHTVALLDLKKLRRDQIFFVDKNNDNGVSELYSLDEFSVRAREDVCKAYLLGRYGSIPFLGDGDSLWK